MANQNGRNVTTTDDNRGTWRPQDESGRNRRDEDERFLARDDDRFSREGSYWEDRSSRGDRDEGFRSSERYGQGQSGYGSGRYEEDRSFSSRNMGYPSHMDERGRERGLDERFSQGRGGPMWGQGGQQMGYGRNDRSWGNEGYSGQYSNYGSPGQWSDHQQGGMYGHGPGSWGQSDQYNTNYDRQQQYGQSGYGQGMPGSSSHGMYGESMQGGSRYNMLRGGYGRHPQQGYGQGYGGQGQQRWGQQGMQGFAGQQSHRGKGPSGYMRSDERIREMVCEALTDDHHIDASNIDVVVKNGEVVLSGTVDDRQQKRLAEDCVEQVSGVKDVQNQIRVATGDKKASGKDREIDTTTTGSSTSDKRHRA